MFARSAASDTLQGRAIQASNVQWGDEDVLQRKGMESIGFPVCKKKYAPFCFPIEEPKTRRRPENVGEARQQAPQTPAVVVGVERMYGCRIHHALRKAVIEKHGERQGWESFGQWSLQKAKEMAKRESIRLQQQRNNNQEENDEAEGETDQVDEDSCVSLSLLSSSSSTTSSSDTAVCRDTTISRQKKNKRKNKTAPLTNMCMNGTCAWKVKSAYDDIYYEINGHTESEAEDNPTETVS